MQRRAFLVHALGLATAARWSADGIAPTIWCVWPAGAGTQSRFGLAFGRQEAATTARLFRRDVTLETGRALAPAGSHVSLVVSGLEDPAAFLQLASRCAARRTVVINTMCSSPGARAPVSKAWTYHVAPLHGGITWHPTLERYGAAQLNARFREHARVGMESAGWQAWFGCKLAVEAVLRARSSDAAAIADFLASPAATFDGHKGTGLWFDPVTHELQQPLYAAAESP